MAVTKQAIWSYAVTSGAASIRAMLNLLFLGGVFRFNVAGLMRRTVQRGDSDRQWFQQGANGCRYRCLIARGEAFTATSSFFR